MSWANVVLKTWASEKIAVQWARGRQRETHAKRPGREEQTATDDITDKWRVHAAVTADDYNRLGNYKNCWKVLPTIILVTFEVLRNLNNHPKPLTIL